MGGGWGGGRVLMTCLLTLSCGWWGNSSEYPQDGFDTKITKLVTEIPGLYIRFCI